MNVLILEDENRAANHLMRLVGAVEPEIKILKVIDTIREAIKYLSDRSDIALIFADIQLADGLSFEVFRKVEVTCPIIFTTAYDTYAIEAFNTNGIDYLLKPIEEERLKQAIRKARKFNVQLDLSRLVSITTSLTESSKKTRFLVKVGERIKTIPVGDIKAFYILGKATFLLTNENRNYTIDYSLDELQNLVDPVQFFRINRKYIISIDACSSIHTWSNSRLKLDITGLEDDRIVVAREKVQEFKKWLDR
jgi:DNA-binding LytR/AlgR family response regulator